jgi:hypothetical protein
LKKFPDNGWSLRGAALALRREGRTEEAARMESRFKDVWASADVEGPVVSASK